MYDPCYSVPQAISGEKKGGDATRTRQAETHLCIQENLRRAVSVGLVRCQ